MTRFERFVTAALVIGTACVSGIAAQGLPDRPTGTYLMLPQGIVDLPPDMVVALVAAESDTVFVQAIDSSAVVLWDGRKRASRLGITVAADQPIPPPDAEPVLCIQHGEVCVIFVSYDGGAFHVGIVYRPAKRA